VPGSANITYYFRCALEAWLRKRAGNRQNTNDDDDQQFNQRKSLVVLFPLNQVLQELSFSSVFMRFFSWWGTKDYNLLLYLTCPLPLRFYHPLQKNFSLVGYGIPGRSSRVHSQPLQPSQSLATKSNASSSVVGSRVWDVPVSISANAPVTPWTETPSTPVRGKPQ